MELFCLKRLLVHLSIATLVVELKLKAFEILVEMTMRLKAMVAASSLGHTHHHLQEL